MDKTLTSKRAPQAVFDLFKSDPDTARKDAMAWLLGQPKDRRTIYIVPDPETGDDLMLSHPGLI